MYQTGLQVLQKIIEAGYDAYMVGGYPRDYYLKRSSVDIDICTSATPKELKEVFRDSMLPNVQYGSVTVIVNRIRFEITTFRRDVKYENNRLPVKIKYIKSLEEDLKRRDFLINTLCMNEKGELIDLLSAREDLDHQIIRTVGPAKPKIKEDSLRMLRAVRFATSLGFSLDSNLEKAIKRYRGLLKKLSYHRKKEELEKIFSSSNCANGILLLDRLELEKPLELSHLRDVVPTTSPIGIWAQLDVLERYPFSNNEKDLIQKLNVLQTKDLLDPIILYQYGLYLCSLASEIQKKDRRLITEKYDALPIHNKRDIQIQANQICAVYHRSPGPFLSKILNCLETEILKGTVQNEYEDLVEFLQKKEQDFEQILQF